MAKKDDNKNWLDTRGNAVPVKYVKEIDKERDRTVERIYSRYLKLQAKLKKAKREVIDEFERYLEYSAQNSQTQPGGIKGNVTLTDFSGTVKVERSIQDYIDFDERINTVKQLIDQCISKWSQDIVTPIKPIIDKVFEVDSKARLNIKGLKSLRELKISDPIWQQAMDLLSEAEKVIETKEYFRVYERDASGIFKAISLDWSSIEPLPPTTTPTKSSKSS
jgi:hypothetical protein